MIESKHNSRIKEQNLNGFTLVEVLITFAVIGIVAMLTLPNLIQNHNEKSWVTAKSVFEKICFINNTQIKRMDYIAKLKTAM